MATGSKLEFIGGEKPYTEMHHDMEMAAVYERNARAIGRDFPDLGPMATRMAASTDMGNVSLALPSIHPVIGINSFPAVNHQPEFTAHCISQDADKALYDGAVAMAWTAIDMAMTEGLRTRLLSRPADQ